MSETSKPNPMLIMKLMQLAFMLDENWNFMGAHELLAAQRCPRCGERSPLFKKVYLAYKCGCGFFCPGKCGWLSVSPIAKYNARGSYQSLDSGEVIILDGFGGWDGGEEYYETESALLKSSKRTVLERIPAPEWAKIKNDGLAKVKAAAPAEWAMVTAGVKMHPQVVDKLVAFEN